MAKLKRDIGLAEAVFYGLGIIIGAGIYVLIAPAADLAGNAVWIAFALAALLAAFTGLSYAELGSMFPRAAAEYIYIRRAYRSNMFAFMLGWLIIFTGIVSISAVSIGFSSYFGGLLGIPQGLAVLVLPVVSVALIIVMGFVNSVGIREISKTNLIMTSIVIGGLILVISVGVGSFGKVDYFEMPKGLDGVFLASSLIFFAYLGFEQIVNVAEETKNPRKILPKAIILAVVFSTIVYVLTSFSVVSVLGWEGAASSQTPLADVVAKVAGPYGNLITTLIALIATGGTVLGLVLVSTRMIYGMSREGALPRAFSRLTKNGIPFNALIIVVIASAAFVFFGDIDTVASATSMGALIIFLNVNIALIWLRYTKPHFSRPFKSPLNIGKYPLLAAAGIFVSILMLFQFSADLLFVGAVVIAIGAVVFLVYRRRDYTALREAELLVEEVGKEARMGTRRQKVRRKSGSRR